MFNFFKSKTPSIAFYDDATKLKRCEGPGQVFSIEVPCTWNDMSTADRLNICAPDNGPAFTGTVYSTGHPTTPREAADLRFSAVEKDMVFLQQIGSEKALGDNGFLRHYEGYWPGEKTLTTYVVACKTNTQFIVSLTLVTNPEEYKANRSFYLKTFDGVQF